MRKNVATLRGSLWSTLQITPCCWFQFQMRVCPFKPSATAMCFLPGSLTQNDDSKGSLGYTVICLKKRKEGQKKKKKRLQGWLSSEHFLLLWKESNSVPHILVRQLTTAWHSSSMGGDALFWLLWALNTCGHTLRDKKKTGDLILKTKWMFSRIHSNFFLKKIISYYVTHHEIESVIHIHSCKF